MPWHLRTRSTLWCGMEPHKNINAQSTTLRSHAREVCVIFADFTFLTQKKQQPSQQFQRSFFVTDKSEFTQTKLDKASPPILAFFARVTACSFAVSAHVCWNWAARAVRTATPRFIPGSYVEYVQKLGHEAPGIYS